MFLFLALLQEDHFLITNLPFQFPSSEYILIGLLIHPSHLFMHKVYCSHSTRIELSFSLHQVLGSL